MKSRMIGLGVIGLMLLACGVRAAVYYVNAGNPAPAPPYNTWAIAATNIQDAVNSAGTGDTVLVTNGIYAYGGLAVAGSLTNRVSLTNALTVQSVNGPWVTTIEGAGAINGNSAVRCAWLTNGATLNGFTLTGGASQTSGNSTTEYGGGVWCASSNALVRNCVIISNTAYQNGGAVYQGTVKNSLIISNSASAPFYGVVYESILVNCTIVSNYCYGVMNPLAMTNCVIFYNDNNNENVSGSGNYSHCCSSPTLSGVGNFSSAPQLFADGVHLASGSPCIGAGTNVSTGTDIFGMTWSNPPSIGCAEWQPSPVVTTPQITETSAPIGFTVGNLTIGGTPPYTCAWLMNGSPLSDNGHFSSTQTSNLVATGVSFADAGAYQVVVTNSFGAVTSPPAVLVAHCVNVNGADPVAPYSSWATAATNIQNAIAAAAAGDVVLVTNGVYATGGKTMDGIITNRVAIDRPILVQSVNGAGATIILGAWDSKSTNGPGAVRCVWVATNGILNGFTLRGGATGANYLNTQATSGGGVWGARTNLSNPVTATVANCIISSNAAFNLGGGAYQVILKNCTIAANIATGGGTGGNGSGGGAELSDLRNCLVLNNSTIPYNTSSSGNGGGVDNCTVRNSALAGNFAQNNGGAANGGTLINCTAAGNTTMGYASISSAAVYGAVLSNCIVYGNINPLNPTTLNYGGGSQSFCCMDPLAAGTGNIDVNPQLLADNIHLAATSPCIGMGNSNVVSGVDIDGQPWGNPPSIGCDEWQPAPVTSIPPVIQVSSPAYGLTIAAIVAGRSPFSCFWSLNGTPIQDNGHFSSSSTPSLTVNNFGPADAGFYQVVVSNSFGIATSQLAQVVIHVVATSGTNPVAPYSTWATAATNIQDAINAAAPGDIVLVTNGVYASGGKAVSGGPTNVVTLDRAVTVTSVNGYASTIIQGAWDPVATDGPGAVRCAYLRDPGAVLMGFTLQNGATLATPNDGIGTPLTSGGGVYCDYTASTVANCVLSNNSALYGGGFSWGTLNNSLVLNNYAKVYGGGAYYAELNNCTVENNHLTPELNGGAGTYDGLVRNSIVENNYDDWPFPDTTLDNYKAASGEAAHYSYSCTAPPNPPVGPGLTGTGNINVDPQFLDWFHIAAISLCRGAGSALYASGNDLDGEAWATPPSMGCDEVISSNLVGPLSVNIFSYYTNLIVNKYGVFTGNLTGRASGITWSFGDGTVFTNVDYVSNHEWTNAGNYTVTLTAYNNDNPGGVSGSIGVNVQPLSAVQLQAGVLLTNGFLFQFAAQPLAIYSYQYTTNLTPPVTWQTVSTSYHVSNGIIQFTDPGPINQAAKFYRVLAQ